MIVGGDVGYAGLKFEAGDRRVYFPSVVGTPDRGSFGLLAVTNNSIVLEEPEHVQVGAGAILQSRVYSQREDSAWTSSSEWYQLFLAGLSELTTGSMKVDFVTGLPVAFYGDKEEMQARLAGSHQVKREGRDRQTFTLAAPRVVPQPFGALLSLALGKNGEIVDAVLADGNIGVIDAGGKTVNILSAKKLTEIGRETASVNVGAWNIERAVRAHLKAEYPDLGNVRPHDLMDAIIAREIRYYGEPIDLGPIVNDTLSDVARQIIAETTRLWGAAATIDRVLIAGGGAHLLGERLRDHFPPGHALIVENPVWANAVGYWKLGRYVAKMQ